MSNQQDDPSDGTLPAEPVDVVAASLRLARLIREAPLDIDQKEVAKGEKLISIFQSAKFSDGYKDMRAEKKALLIFAIEDFADRGRILSTHYMAISVTKNHLLRGTYPYGEEPEGQAAYKIAIRDVEAFQRWKNGETTEFSSEDLHAAIYLLTAELSAVF